MAIRESEDENHPSPGESGGGAKPASCKIGATEPDSPIQGRHQGRGLPLQLGPAPTGGLTRYHSDAARAARSAATPAEEKASEET
jgi:hypothetical protein